MILKHSELIISGIMRYLCSAGGIVDLLHALMVFTNFISGRSLYTELRKAH
jgi:hypothetical protein